MSAASRWVILALLFAAGSAAGHTRSQSHSVWEINGTAVDLVMTIPTIETDRIGDGAAAPSEDLIKSYLTARVYPIAAGRRCALIPPVETLAALSGYHKYDFTFKCDTAEDLQIHSAAFVDLVPSHTNFAQIQNAASGEFTEQLITNEHRTVDVTGKSGSRLKNARFLEFIRMGVMHIFTGVDHMSFLLGLVLISRRLRDLVFVVTGFTVGHSLTLALAVTGILRPHAEYIDALVALTIAMIGAENIAVATHRPGTLALSVGLPLFAMAAVSFAGIGTLPPLLLFGAALFCSNYLMLSGHMRDAGRLRLVVTLVFGLIHGFGFAATLLEMQLPPQKLAQILVGFNVGVEIGQLSLVLTLMGLVALAVHAKLSLPRPIVVDTVAAGLVAIGTYWFVNR